MKKYIKPNTEEINVKLQRIMVGSLPINDTDATVTGDYYDESRFDDRSFDFAFEDDTEFNFE